MGTGAVSSDWGGEARADLPVATRPGEVAGRSQAVVGSRAAGLLVVVVAVGIFLGYMVRNVPIVAPRLPRSEAVRYWPAAAIGALIVTGVVAVVSGAVLRRRRAPLVASDHAAPRAGFHLPRALVWQRVPRRVVLITVGVSFLLGAGALLSDYPLWIVGLGALLPWLPLLVFEAAWKHEHYGAFAVFLAVVFFQTLHMGEHTVQVLQLLATDGNLARSHGVFGQLDFELVHFVADTMVWLSLGVFLVVFRGANRWLWIAFAAAGLHEVEHLYLFWIYHAHQAVYASGGFAGIMGSGGIIGSPLGRPYLHFAYNVIVIVPMVIALWDQARGLDDLQVSRRAITRAAAASGGTTSAAITTSGAAGGS
ncbi:MAG: hypothetical protein WD271_05570 [Acidimicrobiia bacterium]